MKAQAHGLLFCFLLIGCRNEGPPVEYVLPNEYRGEFEIFEANGADALPMENGKVVCRIPASGVVKVRTRSTFKRWHVETARFSSGRSVPLRQTSDPEQMPTEVCIYRLGSSATRVRFFVGTHSEMLAEVRNPPAQTPAAEFWSGGALKYRPTVINNQQQVASVLAASMMSAAAESVHQLFAKGPDAVTLEFVKTNTGPVDKEDDSQCTTLHYASRYGRVETAKWLVAHKADVNTVSYNQFTPMHMVSDAALAQFLIQSGADLRKKDAWGKTALQTAVEEGRTNVCDVIIASGFPIDLSSALGLGKRDLVKKMIKDNPKSVMEVEEDSDLWSNTSPLGVAASQGDKEMVELLLKAGAPVNAVTYRPNAGQMTALCNAVWAGHYEVAKILCEAGADCNMTGGKFYPRLLDYASNHSDKKMVELLVKHGAKASGRK